MPVSRLRSSFNSILVRLKDDPSRKHIRVRLEFQFHTGSIKSIVLKETPADLSNCFNSILVRLKDYVE